MAQRIVDTEQYEVMLVKGNIDGTIKRLAYWPTRLSNTVLQQLTR
jgi:hypothetical protein